MTTQTREVQLKIGAAIWCEVFRGEQMPGIVAVVAARDVAAPDLIARDVGDFIAASICDTTRGPGRLH